MLSGETTVGKHPVLQNSSEIADVIESFQGLNLRAIFL